MSDSNDAARDGKTQDGGDPKDEKKQDGDKKQEDSKKAPKSVWPWVAAGVVVLVFTAVVLVIALAPATSVWTDDAYVAGHFATIAPRISGQIATVDVDDNQMVRAGQVLATLDDRDYRATLADAQAMLARDQEQAADFAAQIARLPAVVAQSRSQVERASAQLALAEANDRRYRNLASTGAGSQQQHQEADASRRRARAEVAGTTASLRATELQLPMLRAQYNAALAATQSDAARIEQARLNLSYTRILAPVDGMVGQRAVQVGNFVAPGAALMALVPIDRLFITANYREVALRHVLPGQHVRLHVDAYDMFLNGVVDSVPPSSGAAFAPIEPNNATGNFTKIVQRLPVKIVVAPGQPEARLLRMGLSVEATIYTGTENVRRDQDNSALRVTAR